MTCAFASGAVDTTRKSQVTLQDHRGAVGNVSFSTHDYVLGGVCCVMEVCPFVSCVHTFMSCVKASGSSMSSFWRRTFSRGRRSDADVSASV